MPFYVSIGRRSSISSLSTNVSPYHYVSPDGKSVWKGPRKICCFCTLAIVLPALLISVPLFMRFVWYGQSTHIINPSDMKILDKRISTTWCQGETIKINTTFTAYMSEGEPTVVDTPKRYSLDKNLIIPDDHKEYWGFYLLRGSRFKIRTCSRWKGGTLLVVQGENHLEHCAYIGEADSAGDSDQISGSNSIEVLNNEIMKGTSNHKTYSQEEMSHLLTKIRHYIKSHPHNHGKLRNNLANWLLLEEKESEMKNVANVDSSTISPEDSQAIISTLLEANEPRNIQVIRKNISEVLNGSITDLPASFLQTSMETGTIRRTRHQAEVRRNTESGENGAFEDETPDDLETKKQDDLPENIHPRMMYLASSTTKRPATPPSIWAREHGHYSGVFNDNTTNDGSDSESESSFSSSEEALLKCEGVLASFDIIPDESCKSEGAYDDLVLYVDGNALRIPSTDPSNAETFPYYEGTVNESGYYYFIFGSENEKRDNFIRAMFELDKLEYKLPTEPIQNCTNVRECQVNFNFASSQKVIVKLPSSPPPHHKDAYAYTSDQIFVAETECQPRTHLYMIFAFLVPIVILLCAFQ